MTAFFQQDSRIRKRTDLDVTTLDDEAVVYDVARDTVHYLNRTACAVFDQCDGSRTLEEVRRNANAVFVAHPSHDSVIAEGVDEAMAMLVQAGLLDAVDDE